MRLIKFRGKSWEDGQWWYATPEDESWQQFWVMVDRQTVGQLIGLTDKDGKDMYEGDIVKLYDERMPEEMRSHVVCVTFENGCFMFGGFFPYGLEGQEVDVIGNIYEHLELLDARG